MNDYCIFVGASLAAFVCGLCVGLSILSGEYGRGWRDGYAQPKPVTAEQRVVNGMLCKYAELACKK